MIDSSLLGKVTTSCMDALDRDFSEDEDAEILAVAVICIVHNKEESYARVYASDTAYYRQVGLMKIGMECVETGNVPDTED